MSVAMNTEVFMMKIRDCRRLEPQTSAVLVFVQLKLTKFGG